MTERRTLGQRGERLAASHLTTKGYRVVAMNWRCPTGEIDIIAWDRDTLVFIEVRSRVAATTETAFASIDERKREKLLSLAQQYLHITEQEQVTWRMDVVAVAMLSNRQPIIEHVEDALGW